MKLYEIVRFGGRIDPKQKADSYKIENGYLTFYKHLEIGTTITMITPIRTIIPGEWKEVRELYT